MCFPRHCLTCEEFTHLGGCQRNEYVILASGLEADVEMLGWMVVDTGVAVVTVATAAVECKMGPGCVSNQVLRVGLILTCSQRWPWKPGRHWQMFGRRQTALLWQRGWHLASGRATENGMSSYFIFPIKSHDFFLECDFIGHNTFQLKTGSILSCTGPLMTHGSRG